MDQAWALLSLEKSDVETEEVFEIPSFRRKTSFLFIFIVTLRLQDRVSKFGFTTVSQQIHKKIKKRSCINYFSHILFFTFLMKILDCHLVALSIKDQGTVITLFILEQMTSKFTAFDDLARELDSGCLCLWQYSF